MLSQFQENPHPNELAHGGNPFLIGTLTAFYFIFYAYAIKNIQWLSLLPFFLLALLSRKGTVIALMVCWLPGNLGGALLQLPGAGFASFPFIELPAHRRVLALWCLIISLFRDRQPSSKENFDYTTILTFALIVSSISVFASELPKISIVRLFMWFLDVLAIQKSLAQLNRNDFLWVTKFFLAVITASVALSLALMLQPGSFLGGRFLKGVYTHSQYLSAIAASAASFFLILLLSKKNNTTSTIYLAITSTILVLVVFFAHSRTALISIIISVISTLLLSNSFKKINIKLAALSLTLIALMTLAVTLHNPDYFDSIIYKYRTTSFAEEGSFNARKEFIENEMAIFYQSPFFGNGFGMPAWPASYFDLARAQSNILNDPYFQKGSEKGFLPAAVIQEIGMVGGVLFLLLSLSILRRMDRQHPALLAGALTGLFSNVADNTFFMPSFVGFYHWIWILLSVNHISLNISTATEPTNIFGIQREE